MAKVAGIITAGVATQSYWSPLLGRMGTTAGEFLTSRTKLTGTSVETAVRDLFGEEAQTFFDFPNQLQRAIATAVNKETKINNFLSDIHPYVDHNASTGKFDEVKGELAKVLDAVGKVGSLEDSEVEKNIVSPEAMSYFTRAAHGRGIVFKEGFERDQRRIFEGLVAKNMTEQPSKQRISEFMNSPDNRKAVVDAFEHLQAFHSKKTEMNRKFVNYDHLEELTFGHLNEPHVASAVEEYLGKVGVAKVDEDTPRVTSLIDRATKSRENLFAISHEDGRTTTHIEANKIKALMEKTKTGLAMTKDGKVISIAQMKHARKDFVDKALSEFQIPLVPYAFSVPLRTFKFMEPSKDLIRNLGSLANEPELRRIGQLSHRIKPFSQGLGIGDRMMIITPNADGKPTLDFVNDMRFMSYKKRENAHTRRIAGLRDLSVDSFLKSFTNFKGSEDSHSGLVEKLFSNQPHLLDIMYDQKNGFMVNPKKPIYSPLISKIHGKGIGVDVKHLHPTQLAEFITANAGNIAPHDLKIALSHMIGEAKNARIDISGFLKQVGSMIEKGEGSFANFNKDLPHYGHLITMLKNADNPKELLGLMNSDIDRGTLFDKISQLEKKATGKFYRAVNTIRHDPSSILDVTAGDGDLIHSIKSKVLGKEGISQSYEKLQEGLLAEVVHNLGVGNLDQIAARGGLSTENAAAKQLIEMKLALNAGDHDSIKGMSMMDILKPLGFMGPDNNLRTNELDTLLDQLVRPVTDKETALHEGYLVNHKELGRFGALASDHTGLFNLAPNGLSKAKIIDDVRLSLEGLEVFRDSKSPLVNKQNEILLKMSKDNNVMDTLRERFTFGRPFHPEEPSLNPTNINNYYTIQGSQFSAEDFVNGSSKDRLNIVQHQIQRGFGIPDYLSSLIHPNKAMGQFAMTTQTLLQMPNEIGSKVGIGLNGQDRITALRSGIAFHAKRVIPLIVGYEAYKNYNSNMHDMHLPGFDDLGANFVANVNLDFAKVKDALGLTKLTKSLVGKLPGLDQYFHPRSEDEYRQYLFYGDEEVREGRGWLIGSRAPLMGGSVKYMRPNFFRRWHSHWTEAENVDISNSKYSFLPNLLHPLAPLNRLLNPKWWVDKHLEDRPYEAGGKNVSTTFRSQDPQDTYLTINSDNQYGAFALGTFGGGYPSAMSGGGTPMQLGPSYGKVKKGTRNGQGGSGGGPGGSGGYGSGAGGTGPGSGGYWEAGGDPIRLGLHKGIPIQDVGGLGPADTMLRWLHNARSQMGLYGSMLQRLPFYPEGDLPAFQKQTPGAATGFARMAWSGEYGEVMGAAGEFFRRFVHPDAEGYDAYNPLPNNMPSWLPDKFKTGDPYMRTPGIGELQLPGDAYERTHPWIEPLRVRGSTIGYSEEELVQKWLNPLEQIEDPKSKDIVDFGSEVHKRIQRRLNDRGVLVGAEVSIFDKEHNLSGTLDAVIRSDRGLEVLDFKTQGSRGFNKGEVPDKYRDQLTFYMHQTGIHHSQLVFINRDNPDQIRYEDVEYDEERWNNILAKVERARNVMKGLISKGMVSPFETYDIVARAEILSKIAPDSAEFRNTIRIAQDSGLGGFEKQRIDQAIQTANKLKEDYNLYPNRYGVETETRKLKVRGIGSDGSILTEMGTISLAGVKIDQQAFAYEDPIDVLAKFGIKEGRRIPVTLIKGAFNPETMNDVTTQAIVGNVNERMLHSNYGKADNESRNPLASQVLHGDGFFGKAWEAMVHSDSMLTNKFMRVRTALEEFERGEVYGTDKAKWDDPINNFVKPTINSLIAKSPIKAALKSAAIARIFFDSKAVKNKASLVGGLIGGALSLGRTIYEHMSGNTWTPKAYRDQNDFDEYWDTLEYLKFTAIAENAKKHAKREEHVDIDRLTKNNKRETVPLGPWAVIAIDAERKAKRTMYGFDLVSGSLQDAISAIPARHQQIAESLIETGSLPEKQRFYNLLPDDEKRVLGKYLNIDTEDLPTKPNLSEYFKHHYLPNVDWAGWDRGVDLNDVKTRSAELEHVKIERPNRNKVEKARAFTHDVSVPRMDSPTPGSIRSHVAALLNNAGFEKINVKYDIRQSDASVVNVKMDLFEDQTHEMIDEMRRDAHR